MPRFGYPPPDDWVARRASTTMPSPWSGAPSPDEVVDAAAARLNRLLLRIPPVWAEAIRLHRIEHVEQRYVALIQGCSQPTVSDRIRVGVERMRWVSKQLPDLIPSEVHALLVEAGERIEVADAVAMYWAEHRVPIGDEISQSTTWDRIHGVPYGFVARRRHDPGTVGDVARGLDRIRRIPPRPRHR